MAEKVVTEDISLEDEVVKAVTEYMILGYLIEKLKANGISFKRRELVSAITTAWKKKRIKFIPILVEEAGFPYIKIDTLSPAKTEVDR